MFEYIYPKEMAELMVALPLEIYRSIRNVYKYCHIARISQISIDTRCYGGLEAIHNPKLHECYGPIQQIWYKKFIKRFPNYELPIPETNDKSDLFVCFYTNLVEDELWVLVERVIEWDQSDMEIKWTEHCIEEAKMLKTLNLGQSSGNIKK